MALLEVMKTKAADKLRKGYSYFSEFAKLGKELENFKGSIKRIGLPVEETNPYREVLNSEEALRAVFHWYRALPSWSSQPLKPVVMPTLYIWPRNAKKLRKNQIKWLKMRF